MLRTVIDKQDAIAAERVQAILPILEEGISANEKKTRRNAAADMLGCSTRTVDRYLENYREAGFSGLRPKNFGRQGQRCIEIGIVNEAIALRLGNTHRSVKEICRILEWRHHLKKGTLKRSTLQDALQEKGFGKSQLPKIVNREIDGKKAYGRFQKEHRMELLQGDIKHTCYLPLGPNGETVKTYFIAWIDDATRYVTTGRFYESMSTENVLDSFKRTIIKYGRPFGIYVDRGSQYISHQLLIVCSKLGVDMHFAPVRDGAAKGKIEALNELLEKFVTEVDLQKREFTTIEEVNAYFTAWLETQYHDEVHSSIDREPRKAFMEDPYELNMITDGKELEDAFSLTIKCKVTKGTISLGGVTYTVEDPRHTGYYVYVTPTEDPFVWNVHRRGFPDCQAYTASIGPYVDKERQIKILEKYQTFKDIGIEPDRSMALLEMSKDRYIEKYGSEIFDEAEAARKRKKDAQMAAKNAPAPVISYANMNKNKEDH